MQLVVYINGELRPRAEARVSPFDRGLLYGYGLFETMRAYNGRVFALERHLQRLARSAAELGIGAALEGMDLERAVHVTLEANGLPEARIRLTVAAGEGERGISPPASGGLTVIVSAESLALPPPSAYESGISAAVVGVRRNSQSPLSRLKSANYMDSLLARAEALAAGADEAILLNERGRLAECSSSNLFIVRDARLLTPSLDSGILPGITRGLVLELARGMDIEAQEGEIPPGDLIGASEAFMTNSIAELVPITSIDAKPVGCGLPGEVTKRLAAAYAQRVQRDTG